jgi:putative membrane protein
MGAGFLLAAGAGPAGVGPATAFRATAFPATAAFPAFHLHPDVWLVIAALVTSYWWAMTRLGPRRVDVAAGEVVVTRNNVVCFGLAVLSLWIFAEYPIHDLAEHYLFSVHMVQHLVFTTVSAPLLLLGLPPWLMRALLVDPPAVRRVVRQVTRPVVALVVFNAFLVLTHWPNVTNETTHNEVFHFGVHLVMFVTALILWMPMINRLPELPRLSYPARMVYLFLQSLVPTVPASFLTFGSGLLYKAYAGRPELLGISAITDQQVAGVIMKLGGGAILWALMTYTFFKWFSEEQRRDEAEALEHRALETMPAVLTWDDVARELERTPPPA